MTAACEWNRHAGWGWGAGKISRAQDTHSSHQGQVLPPGTARRSPGKSSCGNLPLTTVFLTIRSRSGADGMGNEDLV